MPFYKVKKGILMHGSSPMEEREASTYVWSFILSQKNFSRRVYFHIVVFGIKAIKAYLTLLYACIIKASIC